MPFIEDQYKSGAISAPISTTADVLQPNKGASANTVYAAIATTNLPSALQPKVLLWRLIAVCILALVLSISSFSVVAFTYALATQIALASLLYVLVLHHSIVWNSWWHLRGVWHGQILGLVGFSLLFFTQLCHFAFNTPLQVEWHWIGFAGVAVTAYAYLESLSFTHIAAWGNALKTLRPEHAKLVSEDTVYKREVLVEVGADEVRPGETYLVHEGDVIPADGFVCWGSGAVDEYMLTGNKLLQDKQVGSRVLAGSVLRMGSLKMEATLYRSDCVLEGIIKQVDKAVVQTSFPHKWCTRVGIALFGGTVLVALVLVVLGLSIAGLSANNLFMVCAALLITVQPQWLYYITPLSVKLGVLKAKHNGILVFSGNVIHRLALLKYVVVDKTGTLTSGNFKLKHINSSLPIQDFQAILLGLEQYSTHPLARSLVTALNGLQVNAYPFVDIKEVKGLGIMGRDEQGNTFMAGGYGIAMAYTEQADHNIYVLRNNQLIGWVDMEDTLRPDAIQCIEYLKEQRLQPVLISGDTKNKTAYLAQKLGIATYYANKLPGEKINLLEQLKAKGQTAMLGDTVNDDRALQNAHTGIAITQPYFAPLPQNQVVLLNNQLRSFNKVHRLAKRVHFNIRLLIIFALSYHLLLLASACFTVLPLAAVLPLSFLFCLGFWGLLVANFRSSL